METLLPVIKIVVFLCCISSSSSQSYRKELRIKNVVNQHIIKQSSGSVQPTRVDPSRVIQLSWRPRIFLYRGFLSDDECIHLISLAQKKSLVKDLDSMKDDIIANIEDRISAWTFLPKGNSEPLQIMRYERENTIGHLDYNGSKARPEFGEPLMATVVLYLSNVTHGGETLFLQSESKNSRSNDEAWSECAKTGYAVKPIKGNALLFFNVHPNTSPDQSSSSARCPVLQGEKWCATKLFCLRPIEKKTTSLESEGDECTDEEVSCPQWAASGECEKNPVYMKGTPDYSGSCRKSCNAC